MEDISKKDVLDSLKAASRHCGKKGKYDKGQHSFEILASLDPEKVTAASPHAKRLIETMIRKAGD